MQCGGRMELACVVVLVEWLIILKKKISLEGLTSAKKCRRFSMVTCVFFVSRPIEIVTLRKNGETPDWVVEFLRLKDTFRKNGNRQGFTFANGSNHGVQSCSAVGRMAWNLLVLLSLLNG